MEVSRYLFFRTVKYIRVTEIIGKDKCSVHQLLIGILRCGRLTQMYLIVGGGVCAK